ncbi:MAG: hypothetical protein ABFS56_35125 [Pseudomonadota bacterium]
MLSIIELRNVCFIRVVVLTSDGIETQASVGCVLLNGNVALA